MSVGVVWWIGCDHQNGLGCDAKFEDVGVTLARLRKEARKAGWVCGKNDKDDDDYCPAHAGR